MVDVRIIATDAGSGLGPAKTKKCEENIILVLLSQNTKTRTPLLFVQHPNVRVLLVAAAVKKSFVNSMRKQIQLLGLTFSNFGDTVGVHRDHGTCCRFSTL